MRICRFPPPSCPQEKGATTTEEEKGFCFHK
jgi:hypothetical protein